MPALPIAKTALPRSQSTSKMGKLPLSAFGDPQRLSTEQLINMYQKEQKSYFYQALSCNPIVAHRINHYDGSAQQLEEIIEDKIKESQRNRESQLKSKKE